MQKNILVVEDSKSINNIIFNILDEQNYNIFQAYSLDEANKILEKNDIDYLMLDINLPDGNGYELIKKLEHSKIKIFVLTTENDKQFRELTFQKGIIDFLEKDDTFSYKIKKLPQMIEQLENNKLDTILIVDDSFIIQEQLKDIFENRYYKVKVVSNTSEALEILQKEDISLLILDVVLKGEDGVEFLKNNKNEIIDKMQIPVIILSGNITPDLTHKAIKAGAVDVILKPYVVEELILKVDLWIDYKRKTNKLIKLNQNLQEQVNIEVEKNRQKDILLFQQNRFAQMGGMMEMIIHQWKQPLSAITTTTNSLKLKAALNKIDTETVKISIDKILQYSKHMNEIIDSFRNFYKVNKQKQNTTFKELLDKSLNIIEPIFAKKNIKIEKQIESDRVFFTHLNEIIQVIMNILDNAKDILLEKNISNPTITIVAKDNILQIKDNGGGISDDIIEKIFDPYFSTKGDKGSGIGLYMAKVIIEEHCCGKLNVFNDSQGAVFEIIL